MAWTQAHERWLAPQHFARRPLQITCEEAMATVQGVRARREALDAAIAVEAGKWERFTGCSISANLGLVPSESSFGRRRHQGAITKTGNTHARRLLVEAAWSQRRSS